MSLLMLLKSSTTGVVTTSYDFTASLPAGWTVTRSGATATYRDNTGKLQAASANSARINHDESGTPLGILTENTAVNKVLANNVNPTVTTGLTVISGTGTVTVVNKTAELAASGLDGLCTSGKVYQISETAGGTLVVQLSDVVGNTNKHSFRAYAYSTGGTTTIDLVGVGSKTVVAGTQFSLYTSEDLTPSATTRYLRANVTNNRTMYIILMHLEEDNALTSLILNTGSGTATSTRNRDEVKLTSGVELITDRTKGAVVWKGTINSTSDTEQGFFSMADGNGASDLVGMRYLQAADAFSDAQVISGGTDYITEKIGKPLSDDDYICGLIWNSDFIKGIHGHGASFYKDTTVTVPANDFDNIRIGRWKEFSGYANGMHTKELYVLKGIVSLSNFVDKYRSDIGSGVLLGGQSNAAYAAKNQVVSTYTNGGETSAISQLGTYYSSGRNFVSNMAVGGSGLLQSHHATLYWLENDGVTHGPLLTNLLECLSAVGGEKYIGLHWDHGETANGETVADLTDWYGNIFDAVKSVAPTMKFFISMHGRRSDSATGDAEYTKKFDAYFALEAERDDTYILPNKSVLPLYDETGVADAVHISDAGHIENMKWSVRKMADIDGQSVTGPVDGSSISGVSRVGTAVTVTLTHPSGITDFTPTSGIEGFKFKDDGVVIPLSGQVRTNATTITLTLSGTPSGVETLEYCYDTGYGITRTNLVRGNDSNTMPLQKYKGTL